MKISVVIPSYNYARYVTDAVESALGQSYADKEVIVVDDGSTDDTGMLLSRYAGRITYIYQMNQGLPEARNTGIRAARGEIVAFLDADDMWLPEKLAQQVQLLSRDPAIGLVTCGAVLIDEQGYELGCIPGMNDERFQYRDMLWGNCISGGSAAIVRRSCFDAVGVFDKTMNSAEDWDMWARVAAKYVIRSVPRPLVKIRVSGSSMSAGINADRMLLNELKVLGKLFSDAKLHVSASEKRKALSLRHCAAARGHISAGNLVRARQELVLALGFSPICALHLRYWSLLLRFFISMVRNWPLVSMACVVECSL